MKTYKEKLRDPRWQKKRLKIMERDGFCCQLCGDEDSTLNVHHRRYIHGDEPWDAPDQSLVTLCENCHKNETDSMQPAIDSLIETVKDHYFSDDILCIADAIRFAKLSSPLPSYIVASAVSEMMANPEFVSFMTDEYFRIIGEKNAKNKLRGKQGG